MASSRRSLLASLPAAALSAAVTAPAVAAVVQPGADAALIAACDTFAELWQRREQIRDAPASVREEGERLDEEADLLGDRIYELGDEIAAVRATTDAGKAAKARVASLLAGRNPDGTIAVEDLTQSVLWSLIADHTGKPHVVAWPYVAPSAPRPGPDAALIALCERYLTSERGFESDWFKLLLPDLDAATPAQKEAARQIMQERRDGAKGLLAQIAALPAHTGAGKTAKIGILKEWLGVRHGDGEYRLLPFSDAIMVGHEEGNRLSLLEDGLGSAPANRDQKKRIAAQLETLASDGWDMRAQLAVTQATTLAGWRAKARVVREFNNCGEGSGTAYDDDAMAYSLASDLLGLPVEFKKEDEASGRAPAPEPVHEASPSWRRSPATLREFLQQSEAEFVWLGVCEKLQDQNAAAAERAYRNDPALHDELIAELEAVHDRYEAAHAAMRAVLIRLGLARLRVMAAPEIER